MQELEEWKNIPGAPGYKISSYGNLIGRRAKNYKPSPNHKGYLCIRIPHLKMSTAVHVMVARLWIGHKPFEDAQVNHKDGNKLNNHFSNLEYISCKENIRHAIKNGLRTASINLIDNRMFTPVEVGVIRDCITAGFGNTEIAAYFKCHHSTISKIRRGHNYSVAA